MPNPNIMFESADTGGRTSGTKAAGSKSKGGKKTVDLQRQYAGINLYPESTGNSGGGYSDDGGYSGGYDGGDDGDYGGDSGSSFDWAAYYAELQRQAQERANAAYERNMQRIADAYGSAAGSLSGNYNSTVSRLNAARDKSMGDVNTDAEKSLQQAYINNMLTRKNLNQRLSAMGYNGGATETTMAQLENNYGNSRTGINETLNKNISDLNMSYGDNLAAAEQSYNNAKANLDLQRMQLEMQAENQRNNAIDSAISANMSIDSGYASALQAALAKQASYTYDPTVATNDFVPGQAQQAEGAAQGGNYAKWLAQAQLQASQGASASTIQNNLFNAVRNGQLDIDSLYNILSQLRSA
ncbi:hypothetical protein [Butyrivibrio sp. AE2032]|uniref:hypothetical protein n=1 Tax=Butyrivibrio sp. AE2032 TaxID=1458463 RepID=UPI0005542353|nr:hypothetical protein [Butyrivibrio sp. AE2032]